MSGADVVLAMVSDTWTDAVRRGFYATADQLALTLLADERVRTLLVADHPRGLASQVRRRARGDRPAPRTPLLAGTRPLCLRTPTPLDPAAIRRRYRAYDLQLAAARRARGLRRRPALVTFNLYHAAYGDHRGAGRVGFYAQDDESLLPARAAHQEQARAAYARVARSGMAVWAVSEALLDRIDPRGPGLVVPNGVDPDLWSDLPPAPTSDPGAHPVVAYAGTVDDRLDVDALLVVAAGGVRVRVAGPVREPAVAHRLAAAPGVELLGSLPRAAVVDLLRASDACLLAHRSTPLTESMSPLKYHEYLCSGRPVVATRLGGVSPSPSAVLVEPGGDYLGAVRAAVGTGPLPEAERARLVATHSWRVTQRPVVDTLVGDDVPGPR